MIAPVFFCLLMIFGIQAFAQYRDTTNPGQLSLKFLEKSRKQKSTGWVLLGAGAILSGIGLVVGISNAFDDLLEGDSGGGSGGPALMLVGVSGMVGSIPFFIASGKNRRKAAGHVFIKLENPTLAKTGVAFIKQYPAIGISLRL